jgi:hypothetical protein
MGASEAPTISEDTLRNRAEDVLVLTSVGDDTLSSILVRTQNAQKTGLTSTRRTSLNRETAVSS